MDTICNKYKTIQCTSGNLYNIVRAFYFVLLYIVQYCFCFVQGHFSHCVDSDAGRMGLGPAWQSRHWPRNCCRRRHCPGLGHVFTIPVEEILP